MLIEVDKGYKIMGDYTIKNDWLTEVTEVKNDDSNINVDIGYNETASTEIQVRDALNGGADASEASVTGTFGDEILREPKCGRYFQVCSVGWSNESGLC